MSATIDAIAERPERDEYDGFTGRISRWQTSGAEDRRFACMAWPEPSPSPSV
jgi:hypothetical protein